MPGGAKISICAGIAETSTSISLSSSDPSRSSLAEFLPCRSVRRLHIVEVDFARGRQQCVEHALLCSVRRAFAHLAHLEFARLLDCCLGQVADDGVDVAADVADFSELGRLDLDERRVGELGQAAGDLGFAHAGRADHQDVLGRDFLAQRLGDLLPAPAVAEGDGDGALGASWPMMCLSSSCTISCGVISDGIASSANKTAAR